jgi:lysophospholipase L1-like esterase
MKRTVLNWLALVCSLVLALLTAEMLVRLFIPVRNIGPTFSSYHPYYGKVLKKNFSCIRSAPEFTMRFSTNSLGHRGPEPAVFPKHPILFLGDSFTSGYGVNDGEEFPDLIRVALERRGGAARIPVVNAGSGNIGNGYWLRLLRSEGEKYDPRLVVLGFCVNDFSDNIAEGIFRIDETGALKEDTTARLQQGARTAQEIIERVPGLAYSHLVGLARQAFSERLTSGSRTETTTSADTSTSDALTYHLVDATLDLCREKRWKTVVIAIETTGYRLEQLAMLCARHNVPLLVPPTKQERPDLFYVIDGHWNAAGHRMMRDMFMRLVDVDSLLTS